jgi:DNA repair photolyase
MNDAGIPSGILVAPLIPGVNDSPEQVGEILRIAHDNGAISSSVVPLHLRGEVRDIWFGWLQHYRPDLVPRYEELYRRSAYVPSEERRRIQEMVDGVRPRGGPKRRPRPRPRTERGTQRPASAAGAASAEPPRQDSLF